MTKKLYFPVTSNMAYIYFLSQRELAELEMNKVMLLCSFFFHYHMRSFPKSWSYPHPSIHSVFITIFQAFLSFSCWLSVLLLLHLNCFHFFEFSSIYIFFLGTFCSQSLVNCHFTLQTSLHM